MSKPRYKPNDGWINVQLPINVDVKLREMAEKTRLSLTAIVSNGVESEWKQWKATGWKTTGEERR